MAAAAAAGGGAEQQIEQQFVLRVQSAGLAARLRAWLRDEARLDNAVRLLFDQGIDRLGTLTVDGAEHTVVLQDLPTVVEAYKTLDDANLVKVADVGQVLLVVDPDLPPTATSEARDGVTPPMRRARARHFRPPVTLPHEAMREAVRDVVEMLSGRAPDGYAFHDVEEQYAFDAATGQGRWVAVKPTKGGGGGGRGGGGGGREFGGGGGRGRGRGRGRGGRGGGGGGSGDDEGDDDDYGDDFSD